MSPAPQRAAEAVLGIAERLIAFDTTVEEPPGDPPRDERRCQEYAAGLLEAAGFEIDLWEPRVEDLRGHPSYVEGQTWRERPNLVARLRGDGTAPSLLLTGHIDTVPAGEPALWTAGPWEPVVRDGRLYGRGACDMKGGLASAIATGLAIAGAGERLGGDLLIGAVTDEEINGLGTIALLERGHRADAAVVPEPNGLEIHVAFRGILLGVLDVEGRSGHVEIPQRHHSEGGGVDAIGRMRYLLDQLDRRSAEWQDRPDKRHPLCSPGRVQVTRIAGGDFAATIPARCEATLNVCYVPGEESTAVRAELEALVAAAAAADPWLAGHPPGIGWTVDFPPAEIDPGDALPAALARLLERRGLPARRCGLDTWDDTASLIRAGIPAVSFGPGSNDQAHAVDEYVDVAELRRHAELLTELALEWCARR